MPIFQINTPDGQTYEIETPEGVSEQQALEAFKANQASSKLADAGLDVSRLPADLAEKVLSRANKKEESSILGALRRGFEQGFTLGGSDEIKAGVGALVAKTPGLAQIAGGEPVADKSFGDLYKEGLQSQTQQLETDLEENKPAAIAGMVAGGGLGLGGASGIAGLAKVAPKTAKTLTTGKNFVDARVKDLITGVATGVPAGALSAKPGEDVVEEAVQGGIIGGALSPLVGAAASGVRNATDIVEGTKGLIKRAREGVDPDVLLANKITNPQQALSDIKSGQVSTIADVAGDSVRGLTRLVGKTEGGRDIVVEALEGRSEDAVKRVVDDLSKVSKVDNYFGNLDDLTAAREQMSKPLYTEAFSKYTNIKSKKIDDILNTDAGKQALAKAGVKMRNQMTDLGQVDEDLTEQALLSGSIKDGKIASGLKLQTLDYVKRSLDDMIGSAKNSGANDDVRVLANLKRELTGELDKVAPEYAKARQVFSDISSIKSAQEQGINFSKMRPAEISKYLEGASVAEKEAFRIGVRENLNKTVTSTAEGADPAKRIFGNTYKKEQLKAAFDGDNQFNEFSKRMLEEVNTAKTKFLVLGGSRTDINQGFMDKNLMESTMEELLDRGATRGAVLTMAKDWALKRYYGLTPNNAKRLAEILTDKNKGIEALENLIKTQTNQAQSRILTEAAKEIKYSPTVAGMAQGVNKDVKTPLKINIPYKKGKMEGYY